MKKQGGYMMVELLITLIVAAILILALQNIVTSHVYLSQRGRDLIVANSYAEQKIEALRSKGFLALSNGTSTLTSELPSELKSPRSATLVITSPTPAIKKAHLTVTYNEQGTQRTHTYSTFVGELGVGQY